VNQDLLVLAKTKTSISINNDTAPGLHLSVSYSPFQPPLMQAN
jgi:hypothetical protein